VLTPPLGKAAAASNQTLDIQEEHEMSVFNATNTPLHHYKPPIASTITFSACFITTENYI
jgi:hypothetical protein